MAELAESNRYFITESVSDEVAAILYLRMKASGVLDDLYHQGDVGIKWFIDWCSRPENTVYGVFKRTSLDPEMAEIIGVGFLNNLTSIGS